MPTIEFSYKDLVKLMGKKISKEQLEKEIILYVKGEFEDVDGDTIKIEVADSNRPDLWSVEGIARELRGRVGIKTGLPQYKIKKSGLKVIVDKGLKKIRPCTVCAVAKGVDFTDEVLDQLIQLQEKVCDTYGKKREQVAIGVYDYHKIKGPIYFNAVDPRKTSFTPLDYDKKINLLQILSKSQKGREYGHLLEGLDKFPIFIDSKEEILSLPPIINSNHTGMVTKDTKDVFIECSGFDMKYLMPALNIMVSALADRGGNIESVDVVVDGKTFVTPELKPKTINIDKTYIRKQLGIDISDDEIAKLMEGARYGVKQTKKDFVVSYLPYRQDIMHPMDVIEDVLIGYGFNNIEPESVRFVSDAKLDELNMFQRKVAEIMIGLGALEVMSYTLSNKDNLYSKMNVALGDFIEIDNPVSKNWGVFRTWITPNILEVFSKNTNREYPQDIFEIGEVVLIDKDAETRSVNPVRIAWGHIGSVADFTYAKQAIDYLFRKLGIGYEMIPADHGSFIKGRCARVVVDGKKVAYVGEIHPQVLVNWGLSMPACVFELNLSEIINIKPIN